MIAVVIILPETNDELIGIDVILQAAQESTQVNFIEIGQRTNNFKWLIFWDKEIICRFIANDNFDFFTTTQQLDNVTYQDGG
ncbi:hypothetical protein D3C87_2027590 [compost metagenome]